MTEKPHPGINMHKLSVGGGFMGLLFAVGSALVFVLGFPTLWYFVVLAGVLGVGIAALLRIFSQRRSDRSRPLSILSAPEANTKRESHGHLKWHRSFRPTLTPA